MRHKQVSMATLGFVADHPPLLPTSSPLLPQSQPPLFQLPNLIPSSFIRPPHSPPQHLPHSVFSHPPPPNPPLSLSPSPHTHTQKKNTYRKTSIKHERGERNTRQTSQLDLDVFGSTSRCSLFVCGSIVGNFFSNVLFPKC